MQQDADFITADFLYMFQVSSAHHQEYKILTRQPPLQVVMVVGRSTLCDVRDKTISFVSLVYWRLHSVFKVQQTSVKT